MSQRHDVALRHPCLLACETLARRFVTYDRDSGISTILTVNRGYE